MAYNKRIWGSDEVITKEALNNIENGIEAVEQSIPKLVSQLDNDAGYITEHLDLSNYAEKDELHEHNNKDVLDGINLVRMQSWDNAASKNDIDLEPYALKDDLHEHANFDVLEQIDQDKIDAWDNYESFSGDYNDLENTPAIPKKLSELENDANFLTEHQSLEDYALKSEIPVIPELPTKVSELENDTNFITLEDVPACLITEEEKQEMDNRVKALEEVEHVSLEQYNTLLNRIVLLEEALNDLKSEEPSTPEEPDIPDVSNFEYIKLFDSGNIGNTDFGDLCITEKTTENNFNGWAEDYSTINYNFYINDYEAAWFSFSNSVDFSNYEKIMIDIEHDTEMKPLIGVSRNSEGNDYGYASELNMSKTEFAEVSSTNENHSSKKYIFDIKDLIKTGNSGYLGFYFLRNNEGDGEITIYEIGVYKKK